MGVQSLLQATPLQMLQMFVEKLDIISGKLGMRSSYLYIAMIAWFAILGLAGMQLAKLYTSVSVAGIGFYVGCVGYDWICARVTVLNVFPRFVGYAIGLVLAFVLFSLAWRFCVSGIYACFGLVGFALASLLIGNLWGCIGFGVLIVILASFCFAFAFIALTGCLAGFGTVAMLGALKPDVAVLQLGTHQAAVWIAVGIAVVFLAFQCATTKNYRKFGF